MKATLARCKRVWTALLGVAAALVILTPALAQTVYWELEPARDPTVEIGTFTVVGGATTPQGVNFKLANNKADQPQILTLVSKSGGPLRLLAFKDEAPFLDRTTDASGKLSVRFRTGEDMKFRVTGAAGATYQLSVWRGPEVTLPQPSPLVPMDEALRGGAVKGKAAAATTGSDNNAGPDRGKATGGPGWLLYVLLGGILVALAVIAGLIFMGQRRKADTP